MTDSSILRHVLRTYCNVNAIDNESIGDIRNFLRGDPDREKAFRIELGDAINGNTMSAAEYEKLTEQDFDTQEEYIEALKELRDEVFPGG